MKNPNIVLADKEQQAAKLRLQIAALRMAAPLLADETDLREAIEKEKRDKTAMALAAEAAGKMPVHALAAEPVTGGPYDAMQA